MAGSLASAFSCRNGEWIPSSPLTCLWREVPGHVGSGGILEATGGNGNQGEEFGEGRVLDVIRKQREQSATEIPQGLVRAVQEFTGGAIPQDDMTAVVVRYRA